MYVFLFNNQSNQFSYKSKCSIIPYTKHLKDYVGKLLLSNSMGNSSVLHILGMPRVIITFSLRLQTHSFKRNLGREQIVYSITSFVQYNRPSLPVLFWRVVFRDRTGGQQNQTWLCLVWFNINILYMCKKRSESFDIKWSQCMQHYLLIK